MKAILLAAGSGTRLRPHTDTKPKCLVPLKGRPLLEYQLASLRSAGVNDIVLVTGYRADALSDYPFKKFHNIRYASTNMVSSLFCAESEFDDDLLIAYTDIIYEPRLLAALLQSDAAVSVLADEGWRKLWEIRTENPLAAAETFKVDVNNHLIEIGRKPRSYDDIHGQYMGLIKIDRGALPRFRSYYHSLDQRAKYEGKDFDNMFMTSLLQRMAYHAMPVQAVFVQHGWVAVDTTADLERYDALANGGPLIDFGAFPKSNAVRTTASR